MLKINSCGAYDAPRVLKGLRGYLIRSVDVKLNEVILKRQHVFISVIQYKKSLTKYL